jgi:Carboxypeptidase regulatory-like domain
VFEQTGAVVPSVTVTLINQVTNVETKRSTNESGYFTFVNVRPGPYVLKAEIQGFKTRKHPHSLWALTRLSHVPSR